MNQETLWRILGRYDTYAISTNAKAGATIAYNALVVGGIVLQHADILKLYANHPKVEHLAVVLLTVVTVVSLISIWFTFLMIVPYLWSPKRANSAIFFGDVAGHRTEDQYLAELRSLDESKLEKDLATQIFSMARGLLRKFQWMRWGIVLVLFVQLPALAGLLVLKLSTFL